MIIKELVHKCLPIVFIMIVVQALAVGVMAPSYLDTASANGKLVQSNDLSPDDTGNVTRIMIQCFVATLLMLILIKLRLSIVMKVLAYVSVLFSLNMLAEAVIYTFGVTEYSNYAFYSCLLLTALLWVYPEWYIIDIVGLGICAVAGTFLGALMSVKIVIILLITFALYDFVAVFLSKHMLPLAKGALDLKLPLLFIIPHKLSYSYVKDKMESEVLNFGAMGLGDAIFPTILTVAVYIKYGLMSACCVTFGTLVGVIVLTYWSCKHEGGLPALPALCPFAILGCVVGIFI